MAGKSKRPKLALDPDELERLQCLRQAPTAPLREVQRAQILTRYHAGETVARAALSPPPASLRAFETARSGRVVSLVREPRER